MTTTMFKRKTSETVRYGSIIFLMVTLCQYTTALEQPQPTGWYNAHSLNVTSLLLQYVSLCGFDYICDKSTLPFPDTVNITFTKYNLCPKCLCDADCYFRNDCCPDVYFNLPPLSCRGVDILKKEGLSSNENYTVVDTCPEDTEESVRNKCHGNVSLARKLTLTPVTSRDDIPITYYNQYCAQCNGVSNYSIWNLDIKCTLFADFNFLSSYEEVIDLAKEKKCSISFDMMDNKVKTCEQQEIKSARETGMYEWCNATGTLKDFDPNIKVACESYYKIPHRYFKNVFCFLCNPPKDVQLTVTSECNQTGMWKPPNQGLQEACRQFPRSASTFPYKNIFCYLCNRNTGNFDLFLDVLASLTADESVTRQKFSYKVDVESLNSDKLVVDLLLKNEPYTEPDAQVYKYNYDLSFPDTVFHSGTFEINMTSLMLKSIAGSGVGVCNNNILPATFRNAPVSGCSCQPMCIGTCCSDFALTYPVACLKSNVTALKENDTSLSFLAIDGCYRPGGLNVFTDLCSSDESPINIYQFLPVTVFGTPYKNAYCYLCNVDNIYSKENISESTLENVVPWEIELTCDMYISFNYFLLLYDVIETALHMPCKINMLKNKGDIVYPCDRPSIQTVIDKCNMTGKWPVEDPDVRWACENTEPHRMIEIYGSDVYKNQFCMMCNPKDWSNSIISSCNTTGKWLSYDKSLEESCLIFPLVYTHYPYKNYFCKQCNSLPTLPSLHGLDMSYENGMNIDRSVIDNNIIDIDSRKVKPVTFRSLFALAEFESDEGGSKGEDCLQNQLFDPTKGVCRNLTCYPGKVHNASECKPLLPITRNLQYVMAIKIHADLTNTIKTADFLQALLYEIPDNLRALLEIDQLEFSVGKVYLLADKPCETYRSMGGNSSTIEVLMYFQFFISAYVPRLGTEETLIRFMSQQLNITNYRFSENIVITIRESTAALMTPILIHEKNYENNCYLFDTWGLSAVTSQYLYRTVHVADLLICTQVEFDLNEYEADWSGNELTLIDYNLELRFDEFQIMSDGKVRICLDRVSSSMNIVENDTPDNSLGILTIVCLIISLICLLLTFLTYCLLRNLRTIPGKNNMCLMVALFAAQLSTLLQGRAIPNTTKCVISGVFAHYFWLCAFLSLSVCSFHMYRIFSGRFKTALPRSAVNKTVFKLALFTFTTPAIIVATNLLISTAVGSDSGYGGKNCFIAHRTAFIVTLMVPMATMCVLNVFFFSYTSFKIKSSPKVQKNKTDKFEFLVYIKLFVVTGSTWLVQLVDSFLPLSFLSYLAAILNGLQGLFLFLSYVCNRRVYRMFKNLFSGSEFLSTMSMSSRSTISRTTQRTIASNNSTTV